MATTPNDADDEVIACPLGEREQAQRAEETRHNLFPGPLAVEELADGYGYKCPADDAWTAKVLAVVTVERQCCPFLTFEVAFEPHGRALWLRFRGAEKIKTSVRENFWLAIPA